MSSFDQRIRDAVHSSLADCEVPPTPRFVVKPTPLPHGRGTRWVVAVAAVVCIAIAAAASTGRIAVAQLENAVTHILRYFQIDAQGRWSPLESQSLSLTEALQTQAFRVVAPAGLPNGAVLRSIQRLGSGPATTLIFALDRGRNQFTIVETPASSQTLPTIGYAPAPPFSRSPNRELESNGEKNFKFEATVWVAGSARVALFGEHALTSDEAMRVERAMSFP